MEGAWIRMTRESFDWNRLESRKGWFEWAKFDQAVEVARAHNDHVLGSPRVLGHVGLSAPASVPAADRAYYPPTSNADFAAYATAVVHRYKDRIHVWEIWNEENSSIFWRPAPSASAYAKLLKAAYAAIKAEDPTATVVMGGTVGFDRAFMDGIVAAGAWAVLRRVAIHTYVAPQPESSMMATLARPGPGLSRHEGRQAALDHRVRVVDVQRIRVVVHRGQRDEPGGLPVAGVPGRGAPRGPRGVRLQPHRARVSTTSKRRQLRSGRDRRPQEAGLRRAAAGRRGPRRGDQPGLAAPNAASRGPDRTRSTRRPASGGRPGRRQGVDRDVDHSPRRHGRDARSTTRSPPRRPGSS